jgi:hypothetical protein
MTTSDIEIGDIGMLSYRLPVAPRSSQTLNQQQQTPRRSISCLDNQEQLNTPVKWELKSRTSVLTDDPLGLLNPAPPVSTPPLVLNRTSSVITKPFANSISSSSEVKPPTINSSNSKEDEISSLLTIPTSIIQLRAKLNQSGFSALYNPKNFTTIKSYALDRLTDLRTSVKATTIPLTQSKSLYTVKNINLTKERTSLTKDTSNNKLRGSMSSLISQQSSNSSSLNTNNINGMDINTIHDDIKALRLDPSSVAIPINNDEHSNSPIRTIEISSCNRCSACNQFLYDEEIMNGWSPDDSELHTICFHCGEKTIPNLTIHIRVRQKYLFD